MPATKKRKCLTVLIVILLSVAAVGMFRFFGGQRECAGLTDGILDLSNYDLSEGKASLAGNWEFYWNQLLTYDDFRSEKRFPPQIVAIPDTWNRYKREGKALPGFGKATYRMRIKGVEPDQRLGLRLDTVPSACRIFINENEIASEGIVGTGPESEVPFYRPVSANFNAPAAEFDLIIQVSNFTYARGGIWYEPILGTRDQMEAYHHFVIGKDSFLMGSFLIMALYYACFYFVLKRDRISKYFMLLSAVSILRIAVFGGELIAAVIPRISFSFLIFLTYVNLYWMSALLYLAVDSIYENPRRKRINRLVLLYAISATVLTALLPIHLYSQAIVAFELVAALLALAAVVITVMAYFNDRKGSALMLCAMIFTFSAGIHDILYQSNVILSAFGELMPVGIFLLLFAFSFLSADRLHTEYKRTLQLSEKLAVALEKERESSKILVASELDFLKAQIKPHFIYNSLSTIAALTEEDPKKAKQLLYHLTDYLRGSFNFERNSGLVPLSDELELLKAYLAIEKERFQDRISVIYEIEEGISLLIPVLTIQPIVENAVRHGILTKSKGGRLILRICKEAEGVLIHIEDDGVGMESDKLKDLLGTGDATHGVGIKNINQRLKLFYGTGLEIQSETGRGTIVEIRIPWKEAAFNESDHR